MFGAADADTEEVERILKEFQVYSQTEVKIWNREI